MWDGKVSIFEIDQNYVGTSGACAPTSFVGSTQIANDGTWSWTGTVCDSCRLDFDGASDNGVSIAAKIVLEKCDVSGVRCFSVDDPQGQGALDHYTDPAKWGAPWSRWYHAATSTAPVAIHQQTVLDLGVDYFQTSYGLTPGSSADLAAQAANVFASMVDVTRRVHLDLDLPFDHGTWGQIRAYFPSVTGGTAHSHQADRLCVTAPAAWVAGDEATHEYGHLTHYWVWGGVGKWGSFWYDSDGDGVTSDDQGESNITREYAITAFKEAWAEFISDVTFDGANVGHSCATIETRTPVAPAFTLFDGSLVCPAGGATCTQGRYIIKDVEQTLCDLWDPAETNVANVDNDRLQLTLLALQQNLAKVFAEADFWTEAWNVIVATSFGPTNTATAPLGLCRFAEKLVAGGTSTSLLTETLAANKIDCGL